VRCHQSLLADATTPVACYPRRWDSVSFYLRRNDVRVYDQAHSAELMTALEKGERTFVFVKTQKHLAEFLGRLPATLEFVPYGRQGNNVTSGWVRKRRPAVGEAAGLSGS